EYAQNRSYVRYIFLSRNFGKERAMFAGIEHVDTMGIQPLPDSLDTALKVMEKSDFVASVLGEHVFEYFLRNKRKEWEEYRMQVTPYELQKYLPRL
ncbi:MAG: hypothetical protein E7F65_05520, partial [Alloscardovia omnicolens]|nr:hypothetical protein [Alloscardovia omnicolens]